MEREDFLARVRAATIDVDLPRTVGASGPLVWSPAERDLVDRFVANLQTVDGVAHRVAPAGVASTVTNLIDAHNARRAMVWPDEHLHIDGLSSAIEAGGVELVDLSVPADPSGRLEHQAGFDSVAVGVTGTIAGLAESGSIVLESGSGTSRMASLIPLVHIAVLRASTVHASLSHFAAAHPDAARDIANLVIITGPSRTADIETHLNLGVHGPRHLYVVVVEDGV